MKIENNTIWYPNRIANWMQNKLILKRFQQVLYLRPDLRHSIQSDYMKKRFMDYMALILQCCEQFCRLRRTFRPVGLLFSVTNFSNERFFALTKLSLNQLAKWAYQNYDILKKISCPLKMLTQDKLLIWHWFILILEFCLTICPQDNRINVLFSISILFHSKGKGFFT